MDKKIGRNDPCSCGSGKKYKNCCMLKHQGPRKLTAKWLNPRQGPDLMKNVFGSSIDSAEEEFKPIGPNRITEGQVENRKETK